MSYPDPSNATLPLAAAAWFLLEWLLGHRSARVRRAVRFVYTWESSPLFMRNGPGVAPVAAAAALLWAVAAVAPSWWLGRWSFAAGLVLVGLAFALAYRVPPPFLPAWLRDEIAQGAVPLARPDRVDWTLFWVAVPVFVLGIIGLAVLFLTTPLPA